MRRRRPLPRGCPGGGGDPLRDVLLLSGLLVVQHRLDSQHGDQQQRHQAQHQRHQPHARLPHRVVRDAFLFWFILPRLPRLCRRPPWRHILLLLLFVQLPSQPYCDDAVVGLPLLSDVLREQPVHRRHHVPRRVLLRGGGVGDGGGRRRRRSGAEVAPPPPAPHPGQPRPARGQLFAGERPRAPPVALAQLPTVRPGGKAVVGDVAAEIVALELHLAGGLKKDGKITSYKKQKKCVKNNLLFFSCISYLEHSPSYDVPLLYFV